MQPIRNFENIQPSSGDFARPGAGGYICRIINATDHPVDPRTGKGDYLKIEYDIHEGEFKDYYSEAYKKFGKWWASFICSYKEKALGMFRHRINCIEESNVGYKWNFDEKTLQGKMIGLVIGEEEYLKQSGEVGTRLYVADVKTVDQIDRGDYKVPALKKLAPNAYQPAQTTSDVQFPVFDSNEKLPWEL